MDAFDLFSKLNRLKDVIFGIKKVSDGLIGAEKNKVLSLKAANDYRALATKFAEQADMIYEIGEYNEGILFRAGRVAVTNVLDQTRKVVSAQKARFMNRGFLLSGSSQMVIDETVAEGMNAAREAAFNAEADAINAAVAKTARTIEAQSASKSALKQADEVATAGQEEAKKSTMDLFLGKGGLTDVIGQYGAQQSQQKRYNDIISNYFASVKGS